MHPVDRHRTAVAYANVETAQAFPYEERPYTPGSAAHTFWLQAYDRKMFELIITHRLTRP